MLREGDANPPFLLSLFFWSHTTAVSTLRSLFGVKSLFLVLSLCLFLVLNLCPLVLFFLFVYFAHFLVGDFLSMLYLLIGEWNLWVCIGLGDQWTLVLSIWVISQASSSECHALKDLLRSLQVRWLHPLTSRVLISHF